VKHAELVFMGGKLLYVTVAVLQNCCGAGVGVPGPGRKRTKFPVIVIVALVLGLIISGPFHVHTAGWVAGGTHGVGSG
jgi:hypothetical protein